MTNQRSIHCSSPHHTLRRRHQFSRHLSLLCSHHVDNHMQPATKPTTRPSSQPSRQPPRQPSRHPSRLSLYVNQHRGRRLSHHLSRLDSQPHRPAPHQPHSLRSSPQDVRLLSTSFHSAMQPSIATAKPKAQQPPLIPTQPQRPHPTAQVSYPKPCIPQHQCRRLCVPQPVPPLPAQTLILANPGRNNPVPSTSNLWGHTRPISTTVPF